MCILIYKLSNYLYNKKWFVLSKLFWAVNKLINGADINPQCHLGNVNIFHTVGVVIGGDVIVGDDTTIMSGVVIGGGGLWE